MQKFWGYTKCIVDNVEVANFFWATPEESPVQNHLAQYVQYEV